MGGPGTGAAGEEPEPPSRARRLGLVLGPLVFVAVAFVPSGLHRVEGLGHRPAYAAAVAALMAVWWFTEALPIAVTACLPLVLFPALGVFGRGLAGDAARAAEPFADAYIFLFLGGMALGAGLEHWGLHRRVALHILRAVGTEPRRLLAGMLLATAGVSLWISNTATAVMMLPIAMALVAQLEAEEGGRRLRAYGAAVVLAVAYGANVGGIGTKIGTGTNSIFCGFVASRLGIDISFLRYLAVGLPFVVLFLPLVWLVLWRAGSADPPRGAAGRDVLEREIRALGPLSRRERTVGGVFLLAALLWVAGDALRPGVAAAVAALAEGVRVQGKHYEAGVAMGAALLLALLGGLPLAALRRIPFSTLLLLGGSFAMAAGIDGSGLGRWLALRLEPLATLTLPAQAAVASGASVFLSAIASNTATVTVLLNVLPRSLPVLGAAAIAASCDFMLPAGTPPNAIVFGSGRVRLPQMMRVGFVLDVAAALLVALYAWLWLPVVFAR